MAEAIEAAGSSHAPAPGGRPEAAAVIWDPVSAAESVPAEDTGKVISAARRRGLLRGAVAGVISFALFYFDFPRFGTGVAIFGGVVGLSALVSPGGLYAGIEALFVWTGRQAGQLMAWVVLVPTFYLFFLPFGLLMRRGRRDRLMRFYETGADSYWTEHEARPVSSLERQY